jgi:hypothetical protein
MMIQMLIRQDCPLVGSHVTRVAAFANRPKTRPIKLRGGDFNPAAISIHAELCASICATFILPHFLSLSGVRRSIRFLIS